jgi:C_GCAxxG_C_C family probable redox protein
MIDLAGRAEHHFRGGFNCAEAVFLAEIELYGLGLCHEDIRLPSSLGGGFGRGEVCGAVGGATLALGAALGRIHPNQDQTLLKQQRERILAGFESQLGKLECREIKTDDREICVKCVRVAALELDKTLAEYYEAPSP